MRNLRLLAASAAVLCLTLSAASSETKAPPASVAANSLDAAELAWSERRWADAARLYKALTEENPYNGAFWYRLGSSRYGLAEWEAAAEAYRQAAELGYELGTSLYNRGCSLALAGRPDEAVDAVELAIKSGLRNREQLIRTDTDLDSIRATDAFRQRILPRLDPEASRTERWRADLAYMSQRMQETHYDLYRKISRDDWFRAVARIEGQVPELEDHEIVVEIMKLFVRVGDGHTLVRMPSSWRAIPVRFYLFKDGLYIRDADERYGDTVGSRVLRIGKTPVDQALERAALVTAHDNPMQVRWIAPGRLTVLEVLDALDISPGLDQVEITLENASGEERTVRFEPGPIRGGRRRFDVSMSDGTERPVPFYRENPGSNYWFKSLDDDKTVYFKFNSVMNSPSGESLEDFAQRMFSFIDANAIERLIIDVRNNSGGNNSLLKPILDGVLRSERIGRRGNLFVIIGRGTFSACQNFVNRLERDSNPIFVGEPTSSSPNFVGEGNPIQLPYSELHVRGSSRYWQDTLSDDYRTWVAPDLVAELSSEDYRTRRDPALDAIRAYLAERQRAEIARE